MTPIRIRLRELRDAKGWTQEKLGYEAAVPQPTISLLESGKQQRVDFATLERLADALGVEPGDLLERDASKKRRRTG